MNPALAQAPAAVARPAPADPMDAAFEAANRGDLAPLQQLSATARGDRAALIRARLAAARLGPRAGADPALARLAEGRDPALRQAALSVLTNVAFAGADYAAAARWGRRLAEAQAARGAAEDAAESGRTWQLAALIAGPGAQHVDGVVAAQTIAARTDAVGLPRIAIRVNGQSEEAVFDTGANLSVLSAETARRMGVAVLAGETSVGNGVQGTVGVRVGVADRVEIAGTVIRNVPFLIIDDANLTFAQVPGGYSIKAIVGLPVMRALRRVRVEPGARFTVLPPAESASGPANLSASGNDLFVATEVDGHAVPLHLDTGANQTSLTALYAAAHPETVAALTASNAQQGSAGGVRTQRVATWRDVPVALAGRQLRLPTLPVALPSAEGPAPRFMGVLGSNALRAFESYTIDFATMRLDLGPPVRPDAPQPR